jgi:hypothetical protein
MKADKQKLVVFFVAFLFVPVHGAPLIRFWKNKKGQRFRLNTWSMWELLWQIDMTGRVRNGDEITSSTMHHSFRPPLPDLKSQKHQNSLLLPQLL